jgi:hypothetical protein
VTNAFQYTKRKYEVNTDNLLANSILSYEIIKDLQLRVSGGYTKIQMDEIQTSPLSSFNPANGFTSGETYFSNSSFRSWIVEPQISFSKKLKGSQFNFIAGGTFQEDKREGKHFMPPDFQTMLYLRTSKLLHPLQYRLLIILNTAIMHSSHG